MLNVADDGSGRVGFRTAIGAATGIWRGSRPSAGPADVEFDVPDEVADLTVLDAPHAGAIRAGDRTIVLSGTVTAIGVDDDPVVTVRVGTDQLLVEAPAWQAALRVGDGVEMRVPELHLYPYQL